MSKDEGRLARVYLLVAMLTSVFALFDRSPLYAVELTAPLFAVVGGFFLVVAIHKQRRQLAARVYAILGVGHLSYASIFGWLYEGEMLGYLRVPINIFIAIVLFACARYVVSSPYRTAEST